MTMLSMHSAASRGHHGDTLVARLVETAKRIVLWPARVARARGELALLARFSEHELRDIGLSSQDLRNATALPLDADPTRFLARQAAEHARGVWGGR
jgi:uncharacterized protein YjiS (DUF1127 family)